MHRLTRDQARRIAVRAQLLDAARPGDLVEVAEQLGAIKIDPTATISPAEQTIPWSRIGWGYEPGHLTKAANDDRLLYELDGRFHPASLIPLLRVRLRDRPLGTASARYLEANRAFRAAVLRRLREDGPLEAGEIEDTSAVPRDTESGWYGSNQVPVMLELLMRIGEVAVTARIGRTRRWDLAERVYPAAADIPGDEAARLLAARRLQALGIARRRSAASGVGDAGEPAAVDGSRWAWRVDPEALAALDDDPGGRVAILNPYDGMLTDRSRLSELFDFDFVLEQFKPAAQRVYGYFAHPVLVGDRFAALLDARLDKPRENLVVTAVHELGELEPEERDMIDAEIGDLAAWLGVGVVFPGRP